MAQRVGRGIALLFHDRGTRRWVSGQQHAPAALYPPGKTRYPFYRRLGGPQGRSGRAENLVPTGIRSRVAIPTELPGPVVRGIRHLSSDTFLIPPKCTIYTIYIHLMCICFMYLCLCTIIRQRPLCQLLEKPTTVMPFLSMGSVL